MRRSTILLQCKEVGLVNRELWSRQGVSHERTSQGERTGFHVFMVMHYRGEMKFDSGGRD